MSVQQCVTITGLKTQAEAADSSLSEELFDRCSTETRLTGGQGRRTGPDAFDVLSYGTGNCRKTRAQCLSS